MKYSFVRSSGNSKTGPIPVTMTARSSCPDSCALKTNGCYAEGGMVRLHWSKLDDKGLSVDQLTYSITALPKGQLWRHNVAGDLTADGISIDQEALQAIVNANKGKLGFTYTHAHDTPANQRAIRQANKQGFTVNLSANSPEHADKLAALDIGPVVTLVPEDAPTHITTPDGRPIVVCPAVRMQGMTCERCKLCAVPGRKSIVGFPVHGSGKKKAQKVINISTIKD